MFLKFFGLTEQPFGVTPDPKYLYLSSAHREALASMFYGIEAGRGFLALIAKQGMGKTTLLFHLLEQFRYSARTAFLFQTQCTSREFMRFLLAELGIETADQDFVRMHDEFNRELLREARAGNRFIILVDEAQNLDPSVLETIRLLSDFETPRAKLLQIVLAGQPELADKLASPNLAQLRQRISLVSGLKPFSEVDTRDYVRHRLQIAGYKGNELFTAQAMATMTQFAEGIPRNINNFCFNAMSLACALQKKTIDEEIVQEVIADLDISQFISQSRVPHAASILRGRDDSDRGWSASPTVELANRGNSGNGGEIVAAEADREERGKSQPVTPTEAQAYLQDLARSLRR
jgi:general secretion pathway protein A